MEKPIKGASSNPFQPNQARSISILSNQAQPNQAQPNRTQRNPTQPNQAQRNLLLYQPNKAPHNPLLYLITDRLAFLRSDEFTHADAARLQLEAIGIAARAGCQLIQIREKDMSAKDLAAFTREAVRRARPHGVRVLVNDRIDVAMAAGADGVHLRVSSIPAREARDLAAKKGRNDFLIGVSTHSITEARLAEDGGADFIVCGPVYTTASKQAYGPPLGLELLAEICDATAIPALALGGINLANYREPLRRGAAGVAAISLFADAESLEQTIRSIVNTPLPC
ncbi:MAG TPA: thiamine phosphate synthase [Blastocatellia bacterium]|nr:thiamine phosphate synthase [Blastocatellia bacterium]